MRVHGQQREVKSRFFQPARTAIGAMSRSDVGFVTEDGVHVVLAALLVELERPIQVAVVGDGTRIHPQLLDLFDQVGNAIGPVEQAVVRVTMQVCKRPRIVHGSP